MHTRSSARLRPPVISPPNPRRVLPTRLPFPCEVHESPDIRISATTVLLRKVACQSCTLAGISRRAARSGYMAEPKHTGLSSLLAVGCLGGSVALHQDPVWCPFSYEVCRFSWYSWMLS